MQTPDGSEQAELRIKFWREVYVTLRKFVTFKVWLMPDQLANVRKML